MAERDGQDASAEGGAGRAAWPPAPLAAAFFLSGASALVYELLWFRLLGHVLGSTATATSTLLAAYLFGLGLGAWIFGRLSDRAGRRLAVLYVAIEIGIGLYGVASSWLLERGSALYALGHAWAGESPGKLLLARFAVSFVLVAIPTTLMGGTFPLMVHLLRARRVDVGRAAGRAYAINTAGAAAGVLGLPFALLPALGVTLSLAAAAAGNLAAAACAWLYARGAGLLGAAAGAGDAAPAEGTDATGPAPALTGRAWLVLLGFFLSSAASLALETVWTRHLGFFFGSQIYTFAFVLLAYLAGLFLGGALYARASARGRQPASVLVAGLLLAAASVALPLPFLDRFPIPQIRLMIAVGVSHGSFLWTSALATVVLILPAAIGFGLVFPAVVDLLARTGRRAGESVGAAYVVNTLGTTLGALAAGFVLVPRLGTQRTLELSVLLVAAAAALTWAAAAGPSRPRPALRWGLPAVFLAVLFLPRWDWRFAHASYAKNPLLFVQRWTDGSIWREVAARRILYFAEGTEATVTVAEGGGGSRALFVNGKVDASNSPGDMVAQRLLALVPALFHPDPKRALVIGVGSGTTVATLARFPLESIDAAEISPEVSDAAKGYFADVNEKIFSDPRVRLRLDDGRNFLHFQPPASYDLIISEPSNPWMAGASGLFTDEFFRDAKDKLEPGGVFCQWFHFYNMSWEHIRLLMRTFVRHFPETAVFALRGGSVTGDILVIGTNGPMRMHRLPGDPSLPKAVREGFAEVNNGSPQQLLSGLVAVPADVAAIGGDGPINTDDRPILELEAPGDRFTAPLMANLDQLLKRAERSFLPARLAPEVVPAEIELAADGFALPRGLPPGSEARRGVMVLRYARPGGRDASRFLLLGREFEDGPAATGIWRLGRSAQGMDEVADVAAALAGPARIEASGAVTVEGHPGAWVASTDGSSRIVAVGWICPARGGVYLLTRRLPSAGAPSPQELAADLAARFPCAHR